MSKVTSICGMPRGAGGIPVSWNLPRPCCRRPSRARPGARGPRPRAGCPRRSRRSPTCLRRDRRVALDQLRHHAALGLDAEGQRGDVEQQHVLDVAGQHAGLDRGADRDDLVRVDALVRVLAGQLLDLLLDGRHPGHAADQDDVVDLGRRRRTSACLTGATTRSSRSRGQLVQLRPVELHLEVLGLALDRGDERQVDLRLLRGRELDLRLLGGLVETLQASSCRRRGRRPGRA